MQSNFPRLMWAPFLSATALMLSLSLSTAANANPIYEEGEKAYEQADYFAAFRAFVPLAKEGNAAAEAMLGKIYYLGTGAPMDGRASAEWYQKAATKGHASAQFELGKMYATGIGVAKDEKRGAALIEQSAGQRLPWAMTAIATMYRDGTGVAKDDAQAYKWFSLAAAETETPATAEFVKQAKASKAELEKTMNADSVRQAAKQASDWSAKAKPRNAQWMRPVNLPNPLRPAMTNIDPNVSKRSKEMTDSYFPRN